jgi:hypothetical protein
MEVAGLDEAGVGGNPVASGEPDYVAGDEVSARELDPLAVAQDAGCRGHLLSETLGGPLRAIRLDEIQQDAKQYDERDDGRVEPLAQKRRDDAGDQENDHQGIREKGEQFSQDTPPSVTSRLIGADIGPTLLSVLGRQSLGRRAEVFHHSPKGITG